MLQLGSGNLAEGLVCPWEEGKIGDGGVTTVLGPLGRAVAEKKETGGAVRSHVGKLGRWEELGGDEIGSFWGRGELDEEVRKENEDFKDHLAGVSYVSQ